MSRIGRLPIPVPAGVDVTIEGSHGDGQGTRRASLSPHRGRAHQRSPRKTARLVVTRPDDERDARVPARPDPHAGQQHGRRRDPGLHQVHGDRRRRLPRRRQGHGPRVRPRLLAPGAGAGPARASASWSSPRSSSGSRASTSSRSARSPPTSASCASPTRTRARACGTPARSSGARSERQVSDMASSVSQARRTARARRHFRLRKKVTGTADPAAAGRHPVRPAHRGAAGRRHRRPHAGVRVHAGGGPAGRRRRQDRQGPQGRRAGRPARGRAAASPRSSSTAAATPTTAGSRPSPTAPAAPGWSSDDVNSTCIRSMIERDI